jgi:hypothetical protein
MASCFGIHDQDAAFEARAETGLPDIVSEQTVQDLAVAPG